MSAIERQTKQPSDLPDLKGDPLTTFRGAFFQAGILPAAERLFRYGTTERQARGEPPADRPPSDWINFSEDWLQTSQEVIEKLCLLDITAPGAKEWNQANWRAAFVARDAIPVWFGIAGPMLFDVFQGKRYRGFGDLQANTGHPGGGSQVLVPRSHLSRLSVVEMCPLRSAWVHQ